MAVYSEPKEGPYVINTEYAKQIIKSRMPKKEYERIQANAQNFRNNNAIQKKLVRKTRKNNKGQQ